MAKHKVTETSLSNLKKTQGQFANNTELARIAQQHSVETRLKNKARREDIGTLAEYADDIGSELISHKDEKITKKKALVHVLFNEASKGNLKAIEILAKLWNEIDNNKNVMVNGNLGIQKVFITPEENKELDARIEELLNG